MSNKSDIRQEKLLLRKQISPKKLSIFSQKIEKRLTDYLDDFSGVIANYYPINNEVIIRLAKHKIALPTISHLQKQLKFRLWQENDRLEKGQFGIMQPLETAQETLPDVIIVPIVAFDRKLNRIGYGGGYYDTTIAILRKTTPIIAIGVAFSCQEVKEIITEPFDQKLDIIITEKEIIVT